MPVNPRLTSLFKSLIGKTSREGEIFELGRTGHVGKREEKNESMDGELAGARERA